MSSPECRQPSLRESGRELLSFRRATAGGPQFGFADATQHLNLQRKLDGLVAKLPVLGFQSLEQSSIFMPISTTGTLARAASADRRELENGSGFSAVG
jgi:hypothetical protein